MRFLIATVFSFFILSAMSHAADSHNTDDCFTHDWNKKNLLALKEAGFEASQENISLLVEQLRYCLSSTDPQIRDGVAYEAYFTWLRGGKVSQTSLLGLFEWMTSELQAADSDKQGVYLPFVALVYSEVVRVDRISPYLSEQQRQKAVASIIHYLSGLTDYRGFEDGIGWRHGVAHSADVILQLVLNSNISAVQIEKLAESIATQVNPDSTHFYIYGEPERLARAAGYAMLRGEVAIDFWRNWLTKVASPHPFDSWGDVFMSQNGLAKRNNIRQFLTNLYAMIAASENERLQQITPIVQEQIRRTN